MDEHSSSPTPESVEYELVALARRVRCLRPAPSPAMEGLSTMELHSLMMLVHADQEQVSVKPSDIARRFRVSPSAVSQLLKNLEQKGYIVRERAKCDSRSVVIALTEKGRSLSVELKKERNEAFSNMVEAVGMKEVQQFVSTLEKICDYMDDSEAFVTVPHAHLFTGKGAPCA